MSRFSAGTACALFAIAGLMISGHLGAQEKKDTYSLEAPSPGHRASTDAGDAEERIEAILDRPLKAPMDYEGSLLSEVCAEIADVYELAIQFDSAALEEIAISPDTEVNLAPLQNVSLRSALNIMLRQPGLEDLTYVVEDEVLLITTEERANETSQIIVYRIDDFELITESPKEGASTLDSYSPLTKVITSCVEFDSWQINGTGEGSLVIVKPGMLVISQTRGVHRQIEKLLDQLRDVKTDIEGSSRGGNF